MLEQRRVQLQRRSLEDAAAQQHVAQVHRDWANLRDDDNWLLHAKRLYCMHSLS